MQLEFHITSTALANYDVPDEVFDAIAATGKVDMNDSDEVSDFIAANLGKYGIPDEKELLRDHESESGIEDIHCQGSFGDVPERFFKDDE
ncbi:hypothetical protein ACT17_06365 [Mycolicibacterium conceptionense]|uniref:Uncharacterized protein n=1 Tax=Mycolicibacterium conceptionense TaxID=451644 RepID=A0A0J8UH13_9MYCO|nr:hypothetical protein [Mycolicibacterium conceptionense]KMV19655.1 hypothetical protein ACT17_06365 [Mycolicibacterium conceptionense]